MVNLGNWFVPNHFQVCQHIFGEMLMAVNTRRHTLRSMKVCNRGHTFHGLPVLFHIQRSSCVF